MPISLLSGLLFLLLGLSGVWIAWIGMSRSGMYDPDGRLLRRWSPTERWLWLIGWMTTGMGWVCFSLTVFRHAKGQYIVVPASAPLIDHVIWRLALICILGGFAALFVWMVVHQTAEKSRSHHLDAGDS